MKRKAEYELTKSNYQQYLSQKSSQKPCKSPTPDCIRISQDKPHIEKCSMSNLKVKLVENESCFLQNYVPKFKGFDVPEEFSQTKEQNNDRAGVLDNQNIDKRKKEEQEEPKEKPKEASKDISDEVSKKVQNEKSIHKENKEENPKNESEKKREEAPQIAAKDNLKLTPQFSQKEENNSQKESKESNKKLLKLEFSPQSLFKFPQNEPFVFKNVQITSPNFKKIKSDLTFFEKEEVQNKETPKIDSPVLDFSKIQEEHAKKFKEEQMKQSEENEEEELECQKQEKEIKIVKVEDSRIVYRIPRLWVHTHDDREIEYQLDVVKHENVQHIHLQFRLQNGNIPYSAWIIQNSKMTEVKNAEYFKSENCECIVKLQNVFAKFSSDQSKVSPQTLFIGMEKKEWKEMNEKIEELKLMKA